MWYTTVSNERPGSTFNQGQPAPGCHFSIAMPTLNRLEQLLTHSYVQQAAAALRHVGPILQRLVLAEDEADLQYRRRRSTNKLGLYGHRDMKTYVNR